MKIFKAFDEERAKPDLESEHECWLRKSEALGRSKASLCLPAKGAALEPHVMQITGAYRGMLSRYAKASSSSSKKIAEMERNGLAERQKSVGQQLKEAAELRRKLTMEYDALPQADDAGNGQAGIYALSVVLAVGESLATLKSLQLLLGESHLMQAILLTGLVALFVVIPHLIVSLFRYLEGSPYRTGAMCAVAAFMFGFFAVLASIRVGAMRSAPLGSVEAQASGAAHVNWFYLAVVQAGLLMASVYVASLVRSRAQTLLLQRRAQAEARIAEAEAKSGRLERELHSMPERMLHAEVSREDSALSSAAAKELISAYYAQSISAFIEGNSYRSDGVFPECFSRPIPVL